MISGTINHGITLGTITASGTYASPLTITQTGYVGSNAGPIVYGYEAVGTVNSLSNYGTISNTNTTNSLAVNTGVYLYGHGTGVVANGTSGLISAYSPIYIGGGRIGSGTVTNAGTIRSTGAGGRGVAIKTKRGAAIVVNGVGGATDAVISGGADGVYLSVLSTGAPASVTNAGTIQGAGIGVTSRYDAAVYNGAGHTTTALIAGNVGILISTGTISNAGTIAGGVGIYLGAGVVNNGVGGATGALISGSRYGFSGSGTVLNAGTIAGMTGIKLNGGYLNNGINGAVDALITGSVYGLRLQGTVRNAGTIRERPRPFGLTATTVSIRRRWVERSSDLGLGGHRHSRKWRADDNQCRHDPR